VLKIDWGCVARISPVELTYLTVKNNP